MSRRRRFILISGTTLCVLIAVAFVVSGWWGVGVDVPGGIAVGVITGSLLIELDPGPHQTWVFAFPHRDGVFRWPALGKWDSLILIPLLVARRRPR